LKTIAGLAGINTYKKQKNDKTQNYI
jgi:hypothetical protein